MIVGNDISMYQGEPNWDVLTNNVNFIIAKATEGVGDIDPQYGYNRLNARSHNVPFGSYHFARPDKGNTPQQEAKFFCDVIDGDPIRPGELLFLDFEVTYQDPVNWCLQFLQAVEAHFGFKPLIYLNQALCKQYDWTPVANAGYGLWIADYTYDPNVYNAQIGAFSFAAFQQWENNENVPGIDGYVDADEFFGTVEQLKEYGYKAPVVNTPPPVVNPVVNEPTPPQQPVVNPSTQTNQVLDKTQNTNTPPNQPNQQVQNVNFFQGFLHWLIVFFVTGGEK